MDLKRLFLIVALLCAPAAYSAAAEGGRVLRAATGMVPVAPGSRPATVVVMLDGAMARPGAVRLPEDGATVQAALAAAGGAGRDSYRMATLLLRRTGVNADATCIPVVARHAGLLIQDDPKLGQRPELVSQLLSGQLVRVDVRDGVAREPGVPDVLLHDGDLLALPGRSGVVYVATAQGAIVRMRHEPAAAAEVYVRQLPKADRRGVGEFVLHYPNGQQIDLALDAWRYRPTMVPPGSLIAPDSVCLRGE